MQIEKLEDAVLPVSEIVKRCPARQLMAIYKVPAFEGTDQFLQHIALARGKLKKGGTVDVQAAAKVVLQDWNDGRIPFYTMPPLREAQQGHAAAEVVTTWGNDFDADQVMIHCNSDISPFHVMLASLSCHACVPFKPMWGGCTMLCMLATGLFVDPLKLLHGMLFHCEC